MTVDRLRSNAAQQACHRLDAVIAARLLSILQHTGKLLLNVWRNPHLIARGDVVVDRANALLRLCVDGWRDLVRILANGPCDSAVKSLLLGGGKILCTAKRNLGAHRIQRLGDSAGDDLGSLQWDAVVIDG